MGAAPRSQFYHILSKSGINKIRKDGYNGMEWGDATMYYAETNSTDPHYNLAFEEYILCSKRRGDWLLLWQNANTVVVGLNQNTR